MSSNGSHDTQIARLDSVFSSGGSSRNFTSLLNPSYLQAAGKTAAKREAGSDDKDERRQRRKRSRWGNDEKEKTYIPGMPTVLPTNLSREQEEAYLVQLQIEEISRKLRTGELGIPINPEERCAAMTKTINQVCVELATAPRGHSGLR